MSPIACWTLVTCPHCGDLWHDCFLGDGSTYGGRQGIGVPTPVTREDVGAVSLSGEQWERVLWWLHKPLPPGPAKALDESIIRAINAQRGQ